MNRNASQALVRAGPEEPVRVPEEQLSPAIRAAMFWGDVHNVVFAVPNAAFMFWMGLGISSAAKQKDSEKEYKAF